MTTSTGERARPRCRCPRCLAASALLLIRTGRPGMAARLLEGMPQALDAALEQAFAAGKAEGLAEAGKRSARGGRKTGHRT